MNKAIVSGVVSSYGPKISWTESGKPQTAFTLVLDKAGYKTFIPCLCVGTKAPEVAETINSGDLLLVEGSLSWKAGRGSQEAGKLQVVCFDVERLQDSTRTDHEASPAAVAPMRPRSTTRRRARLRRTNPASRGMASLDSNHGRLRV